MKRDEQLEAAIQDLAEQAVSRQVFPGTVIGYIRGGRQGVVYCGRQEYDTASPNVAADTIYDVASVTKSIPTSTLALQLIEAGQLGLDDAVADYVPRLSNQYTQDATIRHLLTYTLLFDLPGGLAQFARANQDNLLDALLSTPLQSRPGTHYYYTNPPAILLGLVIEHVVGERLDRIAHQRLFEPLGMTDTSFAPNQAVLERVAPTELDWRGKVRGAPHDEAAWILRQHGVMAGNAGVFSTAPDLMKFAQMLLNGGQVDGRVYLTPETLKRMQTNQLTKIRAVTGLGWEIIRPEVMGAAARPGIVIKSGFTGCLVVVDLEHQAAIIHLSNRIYPKRPDREPIREFWRSLNELVFAGLK